MKRVWLEGLSPKELRRAQVLIEKGRLVKEYDAVCPKNHLAYQSVTHPGKKVHCSWCEAQYSISKMKIFSHYVDALSI